MIVIVNLWFPNFFWKEWKYYLRLFIFSVGDTKTLAVYNRGSHTTSKSAFILREWACGEAQLVVWRRGRFIPGEWRMPLLILSFTSPQLRFYFSSIFYLRFLVAADFSASTINKFSKYFSETHSPCHKWPQRAVTTLPWITSPDWLLRILNNFSFSEKFSLSQVVWLPLISIEQDKENWWHYIYNSECSLNCAGEGTRERRYGNVGTEGGSS